MATGQEGTTSARAGVLMHTGTYAYTRARVTGNCESQFATAGIRKARSWIQPRGCVELIGCGGELGHRRFTTAAGSVAFCIACRVREVSDIGDFNCARKIGLWHVRATNASDWSLFELKMKRENKRFYSTRTREWDFSYFSLNFYFKINDLCLIIMWFTITRLEVLFAKPIWIVERYYLLS